MKHFSWQHTIITVLAMVIVAGFECIAAFYFHKDGMYLAGSAIVVASLANTDIRHFILSIIPRYLPKNVDKGEENETIR